MRVRILLLVAVAGAAALIAVPRPMAPEAEPPRLAWVATARQFGPVGYRDPAGAISPDARWIAYSEGRFLRVRPIDGGPAIEFPPGDAQNRRLAWDASGRTIVTDGGSGATRWARYDVAARTREPLATPPDLREGACVDTASGERRSVKPCGGAPVTIEHRLASYGPLAVAPDAQQTIYFAAPSEDQSLCWSPNGRWIAYHSHKEHSDDIWLRPADGRAAGTRASFLGRGAETGWPRWSPDGRWVVFNSADKATGLSALYLIGIDERTGGITHEPRPVTVRGIAADIFHAEWIGSDTLVVIAKEQPGEHVIFTVSREGGDAHVVYRLASEHDHPGLAVSPDGREVAFVAPAADGYFQIFRIPLAGGSPVQVTRDPSHKTQPAWSPDGRTIAFTVWNYDAQFWKITFAFCLLPFDF